MDRGDCVDMQARKGAIMMSSMFETPAIIEIDAGRESQMIEESALSGMFDEQEIEAGALLILACMVGYSFARMWKPGMNDIPHSGSLPREEYVLERSLPLEVDGTFNLNGRPWLMLK
jgi:hypothetical protein